MGRGLWHGAAVGGERLHAHARNRTQSASQSVSRRMLGTMSTRGHQAGMVKTIPKSGQTLSTRSTVQCLV